jgi:hypothetical protein
VRFAHAAPRATKKCFTPTPPLTPSAAKSFLNTVEGLNATVEYSSVVGVERAPTAFEALCREAQTFKEVRSAAIAAAAALRTRGPGAPTFSPGVGAASELLALAREAATRIAQAHPAAPGGGGGGGGALRGEARAGDSVFARLYAAQITDAALEELGREIGARMEALASDAGGGNNSAAGGGGSESPSSVPPPPEPPIPTTGAVVGSKLAELVRERGEEEEALRAAASLLQRIYAVSGSGGV